MRTSLRAVGLLYLFSFGPTSVHAGGPVESGPRSEPPRASESAAAASQPTSALSPETILAFTAVINQTTLLGAPSGEAETVSNRDVVEELRSIAQEKSVEGAAAARLLDVLQNAREELPRLVEELRAAGHPDTADQILRWTLKYATDRAVLMAKTIGQALEQYVAARALPPLSHPNSLRLTSDHAPSGLNDRLSLFESIVREAPQEAAVVAGKSFTDPKFQTNGSAQFMLRRLGQAYREGALTAPEFLSPVIKGFRRPADYMWQREAMALIGSMGDAIQSSWRGPISVILGSRARVPESAPPMAISVAESAKAAMTMLGMELPPEPKITQPESVATSVPVKVERGFRYPIAVYPGGAVGAWSAAIWGLSVGGLAMAFGFGPAALLATLVRGARFAYVVQHKNRQNANLAAINAAADALEASGGRSIDAVAPGFTPKIEKVVVDRWPLAAALYVAAVLGIMACVSFFTTAVPLSLFLALSVTEPVLLYLGYRMILEVLNGVLPPR